jgi:hypothetical protein
MREMYRMSVSTEAASFAHDPESLTGAEFAAGDLTETQGAGDADDYDLIATRRAQLEDAETLRRMRAL